MNIKKYLQELKAMRPDLKIYLETRHNGAWGFIVTKLDNVLLVQNGPFPDDSCSISLQYPPSRNNGSGCACAFTADQLNSGDVEAIETDGLRFAKHLKAKLYSKSEEFFDTYWAKNYLEEVL